MFNRRFLALAAWALCLTGLAAAPASALPVAAHQDFAADGSAPNLLQVRSGGGHHHGHRPVYRRHHGHYGNYGHGYHGHRYDRRRYWTHWDYRYHGPRCRTWTSYCNNYYGGWYYANPWWGMPMIGAGVVISGGGSRHVALCEGRYRSYDRRTNSWVSNSGKRRQCVSPYGP